MTTQEHFPLSLSKLIELSAHPHYNTRGEATMIYAMTCVTMIYATLDALMGHASAATYPALRGYDPVQMSGRYNECLTRGNWLTLYHIQSNEYVFHIIIYQLHTLILQVHPDSDRTSQLQSYRDAPWS
jgi:hypothetical protein